MFSNFTNVSPDSLVGPDNPCIRYVGNSFLITWWQYLFDVTRCYRNLSYTPVVSLCVRLGGRSAPPRIGITLKFSRLFFREILKYQITWKSVQWEPSCSVRTDMMKLTFQNTNLVHILLIFNNISYITLHPHTVRLLTEGDDTRGCGDAIGPPDDEQRAARNMLRSVM